MSEPAGDDAPPTAAAATDVPGPGPTPTDDDDDDDDDADAADDDDDDDGAADDGDRSPHAFADPQQEREFLAAQEAFVHPPRVQEKSRLLLLTLGLFIGATVLQGGANTMTELGILLGVLLFHELGHAFAMLVFGYTDVRVFFIPFFGAAAAGKRHGVARWKQGVVLMMGPLPGLAIGCVLLLRGAEGAMFSAATQLVAINAFNLLPIAPFDGGQIANLVLFSRHRHLEIGFLGVAAVALIVLAFLLGAWIFGVVALFMLLGLPVRKQVLAAAQTLRSARLPEDARELDEPQRRSLFEQVWTHLPPQWRGKPTSQASGMEGIHEAAVQRPLSLGGSTAIGVLWLAGLVITVLAIYAVVATPRDVPVPPAQWQRYYNTAGTFSIELPAQPVESSDPQKSLVATYGTREYGVLWAPMPIEAIAEWGKSIETSGAPGGRSRRLRDLEIPDSVSAFVMKTDEGLYTTVRIVARGGTGYAVLGGAYRDDPDAERVVRSFRFETKADPW